MNKPFWEGTYRKHDVSTFGIKPNKTIEENWPMFAKNGFVLEVGCGEGKSSIFLAQKGFSVDAFDISKSGIAKLKRLAEESNTRVNAWVQDLRDYHFKREYDVVTSHGTLHLVTKEEWYQFINKAKKNTKSGGFHIMQIFTNKLPASPDIEPFVRGMADEDELFELYSDWKVLEAKSYVFEDQHPGVPKHFHAANKIVARK